VESARENRANSAEAAVEAAEQLGFPVVLRVDSPDIPHKTEAGVVRLNLGDAAQVRTAYADILACAKAYAPQARIIGVSVQEMVGEGVEVIIGVSCDPQLGPVHLFGSGGEMVEVYNDVALRRCPITRSEAQAMIAEVKGARLLQGFRGRPAADLDALEDTLVRAPNLPHFGHLPTPADFSQAGGRKQTHETGHTKVSFLRPWRLRLSDARRAVAQPVFPATDLLEPPPGLPRGRRGHAAPSLPLIFPGGGASEQSVTWNEDEIPNLVHQTVEKLTRQ
jgi:hypothetical protein